MCSKYTYAKMNKREQWFRFCQMDTNNSISSTFAVLTYCLLDQLKSNKIIHFLTRLLFNYNVSRKYRILFKTNWTGVRGNIKHLFSIYIVRYLENLWHLHTSLRWKREGLEGTAVQKKWTGFI